MKNDRRYFEDIVKNYVDAKLNKHGLNWVFDHLSEIMRESEPEVREEIRRRGKDERQAAVSIAGHSYQRAVAYLIQKAVLGGVIRKNTLEVIVRPKQTKKGENIMKNLTIHIEEERQKPDVDILIFDKDDKNSPVLIISCKTSFRERAGQTYKWKLLYDIATAPCEKLIRKYGIKYIGPKNVRFALVSANFYSEYTNPQIRGIFSFFDGVFISKHDISETKYVKKLSKIINYLNSIF